eukprot:CFRG2413T1
MFVGTVESTGMDVDNTSVPEASVPDEGMKCMNVDNAIDEKTQLVVNVVHDQLSSTSTTVEPSMPTDGTVVVNDDAVSNENSTADVSGLFREVLSSAKVDKDNTEKDAVKDECSIAVQHSGIQLNVVSDILPKEKEVASGEKYSIVSGCQRIVGIDDDEVNKMKVLVDSGDSSTDVNNLTSNTANIVKLVAVDNVGVTVERVGFNEDVDAISQTALDIKSDNDRTPHKEQHVKNLTLENMIEKIKKLEDYTAALKSGFTCTICMDFFCKPYSLECGHSYCVKCIHDRIATQTAMGQDCTCPVCTASITKPPLHTLVLETQMEILNVKDNGQNVVGYQNRKKHALEFVNSNAYEESRRSFQAYQQPSHNPIRDPNQRTYTPDEIASRYIFDAIDNIYRCESCVAEISDCHCNLCGTYFPELEEIEMTGENIGDNSDSEIEDDDEDDEDDIEGLIDDSVHLERKHSRQKSSGFMNEFGVWELSCGCDDTCDVPSCDCTQEPECKCTQSNQKRRRHNARQISSEDDSEEEKKGTHRNGKRTVLDSESEEEEEESACRASEGCGVNVGTNVDVDVSADEDVNMGDDDLYVDEDAIERYVDKGDEGEDVDAYDTERVSIAVWAMSEDD